MQGPIWVHMRADIGSREVDTGSHEQAVSILESRAVSARVTVSSITQGNY